MDNFIQEVYPKLEPFLGVDFFVFTGLLAVALLRIRRNPRAISNGLLVLLTIYAGWNWFTGGLGELNELAGFVVVSAGVISLTLGLISASVSIAFNTVKTVWKEGFGLSRMVGGVVIAFFWSVLILMILCLALNVPQWALFAVLFILCIATVLFIHLAIFWIYSKVYSRLKIPQHGNAVMVLGAGLTPEGSVTPLLAGRVDKGLEIWHSFHEQGKDLPFVVSGGRGSDEVRSEAAAMGEYALSQGLPAEYLLIEDQSATTKENLEFSKKLLREHGVDKLELIVATSDFHVLRAANFTTRYDVQAHVVGSHTASYYYPSAFMREYIAVVVEKKWAYTIFALLILGFIVLMAQDAASMPEPEATSPSQPASLAGIYMQSNA